MSKRELTFLVVCGSVGWLLIWGFAAGWAGRVRFLPDTGLPLLEFVVFTAFYYVAPVFTVWAGYRLIKHKSGQNAE